VARAQQLQAAIVALAPVVLTAGFTLHPYIGSGPPDHTLVAQAAAEHTTRWGLAHLVIAFSSGLLILAFLAIRARLRENERDPWSARGVPLIVIGSTLYALLPAMEMAPLFAAEAKVDVNAVAETLEAWFAPLIVLGGLAFGGGIIAFSRGIARSEILDHNLTRVVIGALAVMAAARLVPLTLVQFYVHSAAAIAALWPLAYIMWTTPALQAARDVTGVPALRSA
jgi:hypothetical protein